MKTCQPIICVLVLLVMLGCGVPRSAYVGGSLNLQGALTNGVASVVWMKGAGHKYSNDYSFWEAGVVCRLNHADVEKWLSSAVAAYENQLVSAKAEINGRGNSDKVKELSFRTGRTAGLLRIEAVKVGEDQIDVTVLVFEAPRR